MNKILVTGGAGFIGSHLTEFLSKKNRVLVIDNLSQGNKIENLNKNIKLVKGDVRDEKLISHYSKECSTIYHLAAILGVDVVSEKNVETMECEYESIKNICYAAKKNNIKKIIYTSSSGVYGKINYRSSVKENSIIAPISAYAVAKRSAEIYLKNFYLEQKSKIDCIVFRLFNIYGPRQDQRMVIPRFINQALKNKSLTVYGKGDHTRDFTHIDDCIKIFDLINKKKIKGFHILNIARGHQLNINSLAKKIIKKIGSQSKILHIPVPKTLEEFQVKRRCGNCSNLFKLIKFKPKTNLEEGLNNLIYSN